MECGLLVGLLKVCRWKMVERSCWGDVCVTGFRSSRQSVALVQWVELGYGREGEREE